MKKVLVIFLSCLLIYSYFAELTPASALTIFASCVFALLLGRIRVNTLEKLRHPIIGLNLLISAVILLFPTLPKVKILGILFEFISIASFLLFLAFLYRKERGFFKELIPFCLIYSSSCTNLLFCDQLPLIIPVSIAGILYLYVIMKTKLMLCLGAMGVASQVFLWFQGIKIFNSRPSVTGNEKLILFGASFLLFFISFLHFVRDRKQNPANMFVFVGMLVLVFDTILSFGFSFRYGLSQQPYLASLIVVAFSGILMKKESEFA